MPRRNRIDPWGDLHAVGNRGMFTGNRGCLVDDERRLVRHHASNLWITCVTDFRGRRSPLDPHTGGRRCSSSTTRWRSRPVTDRAVSAGGPTTSPTRTRSARARAGSIDHGRQHSTVDSPSSDSPAGAGSTADPTAGRGRPTSPGCPAAQSSSMQGRRDSSWVTGCSRSASPAGTTRSRGQRGGRSTC